LRLSSQITTDPHIHGALVDAIDEIERLTAVK
jgi:hypothetical protein